MKVLILTADSNGAYPVPASKGGAVATLIEHLADGNNKKKLCDMEILSYYDKKAFEMSKKYPNVKFSWVKIPRLIKVLDKCAFFIIRTIKKEEKAVSFKSPFSLLFYIWKARNVIKNTDAEKIVLENNIPLALSLKNTKYKGQWYYHLHNVPRIDGRCRDVMSKTTKFLCVSRYVADCICNESSAIGVMPIEKTTILYNCVDTSLFKPLSVDEIKIVKKNYGIRDEDKVLLFTGRLTEEKGADKLLEALMLLPSNFKGLIVGSYHYNADVNSDYQDKLYALAKQLGERVIFTGYVQHNELPYLYNIADIAVLPSMWEEPAGLTNLEAMACGIPIITTDAGGIPEYVGESIVVKRDSDLAINIARNVLELLGNRKVFFDIRQYQLERIDELFSKENYIDNFLNCLE